MACNFGRSEIDYCEARQIKTERCDNNSENLLLVICLVIKYLPVLRAEPI